MVATAIARPIASARAPAPIEKILRTTAQHFLIPVLPDPALALPDGEFKDPLPFRWVKAPRQPARCQLPSASVAA